MAMPFETLSTNIRFSAAQLDEVEALHARRAALARARNRRERHGVQPRERDRLPASSPTPTPIDSSTCTSGARPSSARGASVGTSYRTFVDWRDNARSFTAMGAYLERPFAVSRHRTASASAARSSRPTCSICSAFTLRSVARSWRTTIASDARQSCCSATRSGRVATARDRRIIGQTIRVNGVAHDRHWRDAAAIQVS